MAAAELAPGMPIAAWASDGMEALHAGSVPGLHPLGMWVPESIDAGVMPPGVTRVLSVTQACPLNIRHRQEWSPRDFVMVKEIGTGNASTVWYAFCKKTSTPLAIKTYKKRKLSPLNRRQVAREIMVHSQLVAHPHVIDLYAAFEDNDKVYLLQEYAAGGDLFDEMKRSMGVMPEGQLVSGVLLPFMSALAFVHTRGFIHRDIKPENTLFTADKVLKVADFGLAIDERLERPVTRLGTLDYMSPEVLVCPDKHLPTDNKERSDLWYSCSIDSWAVGVLAYELAVGRPPFGMSTREETIRAIRDLPPSFPEFMSAGLRDFITIALQKSFQQRLPVHELMQHPWICSHAGPLAVARALQLAGHRPVPLCAPPANGVHPVVAALGRGGQVVPPLLAAQATAGTSAFAVDQHHAQQAAAAVAAAAELQGLLEGYPRPPPAGAVPTPALEAQQLPSAVAAAAAAMRGAQQIQKQQMQQQAQAQAQQQALVHAATINAAAQAAAVAAAAAAAGAPMQALAPELQHLAAAAGMDVGTYAALLAQQQQPLSGGALQRIKRTAKRTGMQRSMSHRNLFGVGHSTGSIYEHTHTHHHHAVQQSGWHVQWHANGEHFGLHAAGLQLPGSPDSPRCSSPSNGGMHALASPLCHNRMGSSSQLRLLGKEVSRSCTMKRSTPEPDTGASPLQPLQPQQVQQQQLMAAAAACASPAPAAGSTLAPVPALAAGAAAAWQHMQLSRMGSSGNLRYVPPLSPGRPQQQQQPGLAEQSPMKRVASLSRLPVLPQEQGMPPRQQQQHAAALNGHSGDGGRASSTSSGGALAAAAPIPMGVVAAPASSGSPPAISLQALAEVLPAAGHLHSGRQSTPPSDGSGSGIPLCAAEPQALTASPLLPARPGAATRRTQRAPAASSNSRKHVGRVGSAPSLLPPGMHQQMLQQYGGLGAVDMESSDSADGCADAGSGSGEAAYTYAAAMAAAQQLAQGPDSAAGMASIPEGEGGALHMLTSSQQQQQQQQEEGQQQQLLQQLVYLQYQQRQQAMSIPCSSDHPDGLCTSPSCSASSQLLLQQLQAANAAAHNAAFAATAAPASLADSHYAQQVAALQQLQQQQQQQQVRSALAGSRQTSGGMVSEFAAYQLPLGHSGSGTALSDSSPHAQQHAQQQQQQQLLLHHQRSSSGNMLVGYPSAPAALLGAGGPMLTSSGSAPAPLASAGSGGTMMNVSYGSSASLSALASPASGSLGGAGAGPSVSRQGSMGEEHLGGGRPPIMPNTSWQQEQQQQQVRALLQLQQQAAYAQQQQQQQQSSAGHSGDYGRVVQTPASSGSSSWGQQLSQQQQQQLLYLQQQQQQQQQHSLAAQAQYGMHQAYGMPAAVPSGAQLSVCVPPNSPCQFRHAARHSPSRLAHVTSAFEPAAVVPGTGM